MAAYDTDSDRDGLEQWDEVPPEFRPTWKRARELRDSPPRQGRGWYVPQIGRGRCL